MIIEALIASYVNNDACVPMWNSTVTSHYTYKQQQHSHSNENVLLLYNNSEL